MLVVGGRAPWLESLALAQGAAQVATLPVLGGDSLRSTEEKVRWPKKE